MWENITQTYAYEENIAQKYVHRFYSYTCIATEYYTSLRVKNLSRNVCQNIIFYRNMCTFCEHNKNRYLKAWLT